MWSRVWFWSEHLFLGLLFLRFLWRNVYWPFWFTWGAGNWTQPKPMLPYWIAPPAPSAHLKIRWESVGRVVLSIGLSKNASSRVCEGISRDDWMPRALAYVTVYPLVESRSGEVRNCAGTVSVMAGRRKWLSGVPQHRTSDPSSFYIFCFRCQFFTRYAVRQCLLLFWPSKNILKVLMFNLLVLIFVCDLADIPEKPLPTHPLIKLTESSIF